MDMNIDKYIMWSDIWNEEIDLEICLDILDIEENPNNFMIDTIKQFRNETNMELMVTECTRNDDNLIFFFGETGGQNESDNQGWSRDYTFVVDSDFYVIDAYYSQG